MSYQPIPVSASTTLGPTHADTIIVVGAAAGLTLTLPASAGTGRVFTIEIGTTVTSNNVIVQVANSTDVMRGVCITSQDGGDTLVAFETAAASDTISLNGTTKGGITGDLITLTDSASGFWHVDMRVSATGTEATPFSAAV